MEDFLKIAKANNDVIEYIKKEYPNTEQEFQVLLNEMYKTFCENSLTMGLET